MSPGEQGHSAGGGAGGALGSAGGLAGGLRVGGCDRHRAGAGQKQPGKGDFNGGTGRELAAPGAGRGCIKFDCR